MAKKKIKNRQSLAKEFNESQNNAARIILGPSANATSTIFDYNFKSSEDSEWFALSEALSEQCTAVSNNDLSRAESMLTVQAHTLDTIFNYLAQKAVRTVNMHHLESYLRLSFKAQAQCRLTWETLANIKKPPTTYFKQENIAVNQQVNNELPDCNSKKSPNELLEKKNHERLDIGSKKAAVNIDQNMETVGAVNRPKNRKRNSQGRKKRLQGSNKADA